LSEVPASSPGPGRSGPISPPAKNWIRPGCSHSFPPTAHGRMLPRRRPSPADPLGFRERPLGGTVGPVLAVIIDLALHREALRRLDHLLDTHGLAHFLQPGGNPFQ